MAVEYVGFFFEFLTLQILFFIVIGTVFGLFIGMIPGLGGIVALSLVLPLTFTLDPLAGVLVLVTTLGGTNFGGSITSILLNTPGKSANAATLIDGYPMTRNGEGGRAIAASAFASAFGALFGALILIASIPVLFEIVLLFGPPEVFWLGVWGLVAVAAVIRGDTLRGLLSACMGLVLAMVGANLVTGTYRWTFDVVYLRDGIGLVPIVIGIFAIAEMIRLVASGEQIQQTGSEIQASYADIKAGFRDVIVHRYLFLRSAALGTLIGIIPGAGGSLANYLAYIQAVETSSDPDRFGTGDVRGVIAPEASNDAKDGGALIPTIGLGIPGSAGMALILAGIVFHGIAPGPLMIRQEFELVMVIVFAFIVSNILTSGIGLVFLGVLVKVTEVKSTYIVPCVLVVTFLGSFAASGFIIEIWLALLFGLVGFFMIRENMSRIPLILGVILGPIIEDNFHRSIGISRGDPLGVFVRSEITVILIVLVVVTLFQPQIKQVIGRWTS